MRLNLDSRNPEMPSRLEQSSGRFQMMLLLLLPLLLLPLLLQVHGHSRPLVQHSLSLSLFQARTD